MSARVVYIGERLMASGFALSGAQVYTPSAQEDEIWRDFDQARETADLILISDLYAQLLGPRLARHLQQVSIPPVLRLPAADEQVVPARETIKSARMNLGLSQ